MRATYHQQSGGQGDKYSTQYVTRPVPRWQYSMIRIALIDEAKMDESSATAIQEAPDPRREHENAHHYGR